MYSAGRCDLGVCGVDRQSSFLLMAERGVEVIYEAIRTWCARFGPEYARRLRRRASALATGGISMKCSSRFAGCILVASCGSARKRALSS